MSEANKILDHGNLRFGAKGSPAGPVKIYKLSPEEHLEILRKYGPPGKRKGRDKKPSFLDLYLKTSRTAKKGGVGR